MACILIRLRVCLEHVLEPIDPYLLMKSLAEKKRVGQVAEMLPHSLHWLMPFCAHRGIVMTLRSEKLSGLIPLSTLDWTLLSYCKALACVFVLFVCLFFLTRAECAQIQKIKKCKGINNLESHCQNNMYNVLQFHWLLVLDRGKMNTVNTSKRKCKCERRHSSLYTYNQINLQLVDK